MWHNKNRRISLHNAMSAMASTSRYIIIIKVAAHARLVQIVRSCFICSCSSTSIYFKVATAMCRCSHVFAACCLCLFPRRRLCLLWIVSSFSSRVVVHRCFCLAFQASWDPSPSSCLCCHWWLELVAARAMASTDTLVHIS